MKKLREILGEDYASLEKDMAAWKQRKQSSMQPQTSDMPKSDPDWAEKMHNKFDAAIKQKQAADGPKDIFTGSRHSDGDTVKVIDDTKLKVTPDKPLIGKDDAVKRALAAKGYDKTGKKVTIIPANTGVERANTPIGSIQKTKTPEQKIPIPKAKPDNLTPETFAQAFSKTPEGKKFDWTDPKTGETKTYIRKTKKR